MTENTAPCHSRTQNEPTELVVSALCPQQLLRKRGLSKSCDGDDAASDDRLLPSLQTRFSFCIQMQCTGNFQTHFIGKKICTLDSDKCGTYHFSTYACCTAMHLWYCAISFCILSALRVFGCSWSRVCTAAGLHHLTWTNDHALPPSKGRRCGNLMMPVQGCTDDKEALTDSGFTWVWLPITTGNIVRHAVPWWCNRGMVHPHLCPFCFCDTWLNVPVCMCTPSSTSLQVYIWWCQTHPGFVYSRENTILPLVCIYFMVLSTSVHSTLTGMVHRYHIPTRELVLSPSSDNSGDNGGSDSTLLQSTVFLSYLIALRRKFQDHFFWKVSRALELGKYGNYSLWPPVLLENVPMAGRKYRCFWEDIF